jgi:uncharacterized membrane protein YkvA (DUF1232 family)
MKYNTGDKVKIINYGHMIHVFAKPVDMIPEIIGKMGIIQDATGDVQGYSIVGIPEKHAWYNADQLELVNANPNSL